MLTVTATKVFLQLSIW